MANNSKPKPVAEAILGDETTTTPEATEGALQPLPATDAGIMETLSPEPDVIIPVVEPDTAPDPEVLPQLPYAITELGIQPVALASRTFASDFGPGGAAHKYKTLVYGEDGIPVYRNEIKFQNGALGEGGGINGMADSTLLSILADRWRAFQSGPFASEQTGKALECIEQAAAWLNQRTADREARGVQGKHEA